MLVRSTLLRKRACKLTLHALLRPVLRREREEFLLTMSSSTAYCVRVPQFFKNPIEVCKNITPNFLKTCSSLGSEKKKKILEQYLSIDSPTNPFLIPLHNPSLLLVSIKYSPSRRKEATREQTAPRFFSRFTRIDHRQKREEICFTDRAAFISWLDNERCSPRYPSRSRDVCTRPSPPFPLVYTPSEW